MRIAKLAALAGRRTVTAHDITITGGGERVRAPAVLLTAASEV
jgi:histone H3/H4